MTHTAKRILFFSLALGFLGGLAGAWLALRTAGTSTAGNTGSNFQQASFQGAAGAIAGFPGQGIASSEFASAAAVGTQSVVFIKTTTENPRGRDNFWSFFDFYGNRGPVQSAGSGVILNTEGYIVTNNHVVDGADVIEVALTDKHTYKATIVGVDPSTDLAVLKIEAKNLHPIQLANSDTVHIGDWVLAVGNPFNLSYTVTAGIVSAKGRNINIVNSQFPIESFIQTDAAINPGNSGGALINLHGQLIGINTAIASQTGSYSGYGFAIPVNIVRKVVHDLTELGSVQQAFMGAEVQDIDNAIGEKLGTEDFSGVYVESILDESAAAVGGLKADDIITAFAGASINTKAEYLEQLSLQRPGDKVTLDVRRSGKTLQLTISLQNEEGTTGVLKNRKVSSTELGASFTPLSKVERQKLGVDYGYRVSNIKAGRVAQMQLPEGFIIQTINQKAPDDVEDLIKTLSKIQGRLVLNGLTPDGNRVSLSFYAH